MANSASPKKKTKRRMKKQVRKTLGALLMVSAIVVAAIPVTDVRANVDISEHNKILIESDHPTKNNDPDKSDMTYKSTVPFASDIDPSGPRKAERTVYTSEDGFFQFVYMRPTALNPDRVAVILNYTGSETSLVIPDTLEGYKKYRDNDTSSGYCLVSKNDEFLTYQTQRQKEVAKEKFYLVDDLYEDSEKKIKKSVGENECVYRPVDGIQTLVYTTVEKRTVTPTKAPDAPEEDPAPTPYEENYEVIHTIKPEMVTTYEPCYNTNKSEWENIPEEELYYTTDKVVFTQCGSSDDHQRINADVAFIGQDKLVADDTTGNWKVDGQITNPDEGVFANNPSLTYLTMGKNIQGIGDYAFYGCSTLTSLDFSAKLETVGNGAFAECIRLTTCNIAYNSQLLALGKDAFYHCRSLKEFYTNVGLLAIGDSCFEGCENLQNVYLCGENSPGGAGEVALRYVGNHVFKDCTNLSKIEFPYSYGSQDEMPLEFDMFDGCTKLQYVKVNNDIVDFDIFHYKDDTDYPRCKDIKSFEDVIDKLPDSFYIEGPDKSAIHETCKNNSIAFKYLNSDPELYEIKEFEKDKADDPDDPSIRTAEVTYQIHTDGSIYKVIIDGDPVNLTIPETIGPYGISTIGEGAFTNNCSLTKVTIPESCTVIGPNAFKGCHNLKVVTFTDATKVSSIGEGAFDTQECMYSVKGSGDSKTIICSQCKSPSNVLALGTLTDPVELTFCGSMIDTSTNIDTVPFAFAMNGTSNINNPDQGTSWITYHSGWPTNLEVQYDYNAITGEGIVKLVNYPRFSDYEEVKDHGLASTYLKSLPYVTIDNQEYYQDLIASAVGAYTNYKSDPIHNNPPTSNQMELINSALNIVVPTNVDAIKTGIFSGSMKDDDSTSVNYGKKIPVSPAIDPNIEIESITLNGVKELEPYTFADCTALREASVIGPTYIGDYCFENDKKLENATLGTNLIDTGLRPFDSCTELSNIDCLGDNFSYKDGLLFRNLGSSNELVECLESRGDDLGSYTISAPELSSVSSIKEEAFMDCEYIGKVDLSQASIDVVPRSCFNHATGLNSVKFGSGVSQIMDEAFWDTTDLKSVELPYSITMIAQDAFANNLEGSHKNSGSFDDSSHVYKKVVVSCVEGSIADKYAKSYVYLSPEYGEVFITHYVYFYDDFEDPTKPKLLDKQIVNDGEDAVPPTPDPDHSAEGYDFIGWSNYKEISRDTDVYAKFVAQGDPFFTIKFLDYNGQQIGEDQVIQAGKNATPPADPKREGYTFTGWEPKNDYIGVYKDSTIVAQYKDNSGDTSRHTVNFYSGYDQSLIGTVKVNDGESTLAPAAPAVAGYTFTKWVPGDLSKITADMNVIAVYEKNVPGPNPQPTGSGSPSGSSSPSPSASPNNSGNKEAEVTKYTVSVSGGSGSGSYPAGAIVAINAYDMGEGQNFDRWVTSTAGVAFANPTNASTSFVMPAANVAITATYKTGGATNNGGSNNGGNNNGGNGGNNNGSPNNNYGTRVDINKGGISNTGVAGATVSGSTDNFVVKITDDASAASLAQTALQNAYGANFADVKYFPFDISLYDETGTTKIADTSGMSVNITMPLPDELATYAGNNKVASVLGGELEPLNSRFTTVDGVPCINFTATHFSPYVLYVDTKNLTETTIDYTPKTGDPIHPKWFLAIGLAAISLIMFFKKDKRVAVKAK